MAKPYLYKLIAALCWYILPQPTLIAQNAHDQKTSTGDEIFQAAVLEQEPIYRGAEYWRFPYKTVNGIVYFKADTLTKGNVEYYHRQYYNMPLLYDQSTDELVTVDLSGRTMIRLFSPGVQTFSIHGSDFIYITDTTDVSKSGFWEIFIDSKTRVLKREVKSIKTRIINHQIGRVVQQQTFFKIINKGVEYDVQDRETMLLAYADKKIQMQDFLKKNRRKFRKAGFESMLSQATEYYNEISAQR